MKKKASTIKLADVVANFSSALNSEINEKTTTSDTADTTQADNGVNKEASSEPPSSHGTGDANDGQVSVADSLRKIASEAVERETVAMESEATEFGKLFARGFVDELNKVAHTEESYRDGYEAAAEVIETMNHQMSKVAEEAYDITMNRVITGSDTPIFEKIAEEAHEATLGRIISSEAYAATMNRAITGSDVPVHEKIAEEAYDATLERLIAGEAYDATNEAIFDGNNVKLAQALMGQTKSAYDSTMSIFG